MAMKGLIIIAVIAIFVLLMSLPVVRPDLQQFTNMGSIEVSKTVRTWPAPLKARSLLFCIAGMA